MLLMLFVTIMAAAGLHLFGSVCPFVLSLIKMLMPPTSVLLLHRECNHTARSNELTKMGMRKTTNDGLTSMMHLPTCEELIDCRLIGQDDAVDMDRCSDEEGTINRWVD